MSDSKTKNPRRRKFLDPKLLVDPEYVHDLAYEKLVTNGWREMLDEVVKDKETHFRDMFVYNFILAFYKGDLPDDAIDYLVDGMMKNQDQVAQILGVAFGKGQEKKAPVLKKSFHIALEVAEENGSLSDVKEISETVFESVAKRVYKDGETVRKYYQIELNFLRSAQRDGLNLGEMLEDIREYHAQSKRQKR